MPDETESKPDDQQKGVVAGWDQPLSSLKVYNNTFVNFEESECTMWHATNGIRVRRVEVKRKPHYLDAFNHLQRPSLPYYELHIQQAWMGSNGEVEWRDVEVIDEVEERD